MDDVASPGYVSLGAGRTRSSGMPRGNLYAGHIAEVLIYSFLTRSSNIENSGLMDQILIG